MKVGKHVCEAPMLEHSFGSIWWKREKVGQGLSVRKIASFVLVAWYSEQSVRAPSTEHHSSNRLNLLNMLITR